MGRPLKEGKQLIHALHQNVGHCSSLWRQDSPLDHQVHATNRLAEAAEAGLHRQSGHLFFRDFRRKS